VAGSGVNLEVFGMVPYPDPAPGDRLRIVVVSRIRRDKGIQELISSIRSLADRSLTPKVVFDIIGWPEDDEMVIELRVLEEAGLCTYTEGLSRDAVISRMASGHALAHFSHHEGLSNVLLEASAVGRPVIAPNIPGCREVVAPGQSGLLFTAGSAASATEALVELLAMPHSRRREMGLAARSLVERRFDRRDVVQRYVDVVEELGARSAAPA
jgi:galacturonosyltransferase